MAALPFSSISIIYNPKSTGNSRRLAEKLQSQLAKELPDLTIDLRATEYAGHARELAREIADADTRPLIVSSSGDGGYNEVINGVMAAKNKDAICAVLAAGNANDHSRAIHKGRPLHEAILAGKIGRLDLLKVTIDEPGHELQELYAHSYAGLGLTPVVATELNRQHHKLNALYEIYLSLRTFFRYRPFEIRHNGRVIELDSLLFANINQMAKILTLSPRNRPDDGRFELVLLTAGRKFQLIRHLMQAAASSLDDAKRCKRYEFKTIKPLPMQLDGEVCSLPAGSSVRVEALHHALRTIR
ncbi:MAG TPA: diacylglycerol kinase family protein [Candidatus Saccharimonadales bacterium]|nr:diacylglycerol kinase family protein [Candidatus Saccharimonadales bacterium]